LGLQGRGTFSPCRIRDSSILANSGEYFLCLAKASEIAIIRSTGQSDLALKAHRVLSPPLQRMYDVGKAHSRQGVEDAKVHGEDFAGVYRDMLGFLPHSWERDQYAFRVTNNVITTQTLGASRKTLLIRGFRGWSIPGYRGVPSISSTRLDRLPRTRLPLPSC
jgi:hypothetical protein